MENNYNNVEKYTGLYKGEKEVTFNRVWGGHRFTDAECARLCAGDVITLDLVSKNGNNYSVMGKLSELEYNGYNYIGFERLKFIPDGKVPRKWGGHVFTEDEILRLESGEAIFLDSFVSKAGKPFAASIKFDKTVGIVPKFL